MAKDRTRHARRREPGRRQESTFDEATAITQALVNLADETEQTLVDFAEGTVRALADFTDAIAGAAANCVEMYRRLTNERY